MRAMRGMSSTMMSHAEMLAETCCDEFGEVIEDARHGPIGRSA